MLIPTIPTALIGAVVVVPGYLLYILGTIGRACSGNPYALWQFTEPMVIGSMMIGIAGIGGISFFLLVGYFTTGLLMMLFRRGSVLNSMVSELLGF